LFDRHHAPQRAQVQYVSRSMFNPLGYFSYFVGRCFAELGQTTTDDSKDLPRSWLLLRSTSAKAKQ
jgi:hypothetical protein